jgi:hypothetical protein
MVFSALKQAANRLAATVLAADAASIPPVPPAFNPADTVGSRTKLQGAIARAPGPLYYLIPDVASVHTSRSKQISISEDGDPASASDRSETAFATLNIDTVMYGILRTAGGSAEMQMTVGCSPTGAPVSFSPIVGTPFNSLSATIGVGAPQTITIDQAVGLVGGSWIPWAGSPGAPPAIPTQAGILTIAAADATAIDQEPFFGPIGSPSRAMRIASLTVISTVIPTTCAHTATFVAGLLGDNIGRPLSVALASIQPLANPADGPILAAARLAAPPRYYYGSLPLPPGSKLGAACAPPPMPPANLAEPPNQLPRPRPATRLTVRLSRRHQPLGRGNDAEFAAAEENIPCYEAGGPVDDAALGGAVEAEGNKGSKMVCADAPLELALAWGCLGATMRLGCPRHDHVRRLEGDAVVGAEAG